jgi:HEAT repeat protein
MWMLLDELEIERSLPPKDPVREAVHKLQTRKGIRTRAYAAMQLAQFEAKAALRALRQATGDPEPDVRAWAHTGLALIEGNEAEHRCAIRKILKERHPDDSQRMDAEEALKYLELPAELRALERLTDAAVDNDAKTVRSMLKIVDVNQADENRRTAIFYAAVNGSFEAVCALLEAGADASREDPYGGGSLLHRAAMLKKGTAVLRLLLEHGVDPWRTDEDGQTALDIAREAGYQESVKVLKEAMKKAPKGKLAKKPSRRRNNARSTH